MSADKKNPVVTWGRDVLAVYASQGKKLPKSASASRVALDAWVKQDEGNERELFVRLVPKAIEVIAKYEKDEGEDAVVRAEKKSIAELKVLLSEVVKESTQ